jgi:hypothetical protein
VGGDIPSTRVSFLYSLHEDEELAVGWLLETLD